MAMAIFTIGILGLFAMQTSAIKHNLTANSISSGATWASDRVEWLISLDYNHAELEDDDGDGCSGLDDHVSGTGTNDDADGNMTLSSSSPVYNVYWNTAQDCSLTDIPVSGVPQDEVQRPKHLRVIVTSDNGSGEQVSAVFNYIKQNVTKTN
jgi:hypothetical protein